MGKRYNTKSNTRTHNRKSPTKKQKHTANKKEIKATHERWTDTVGQLS